MSSRSASGTKSLISGMRFSVRLPRRIVPIWVSEPIGRRRAAPRVLDAGDERRRDGAEADEQDAELALGGRDFVGLAVNEVFGFQDDTSLTGERHQRPVPLRGYAPGARPVLDGALPLAEQGGERALAAEAADDAFCRVCLSRQLHGPL